MVDVKFVCLDLETTGLEPEEDVILEIGVTIADSELHPIASKESLVWPGEYDLDSLNEIVGEMHEASGLLDDLAEHASPLYSAPKVEQDVINWLESYGVQPQTVPLMGSSVHFDRAFLKKHMPKLEAFFTHRNVDVSSIKEMTRRLDGVEEQYEPEQKSAAHRALNDVTNTMAEAEFYYKTFFGGK